MKLKVELETQNRGKESSRMKWLGIGMTLVAGIVEILRAAGVLK